MIKQENSNREIQITMNELPWDVLVIIFSQLNLTSLGALLLTNKNFFNLLISPNANFVWETQIAHHFPNRYQQFENAKQFPDNSYQAFVSYYKNDEVYEALTREEKIIFSYLKDENISALEKYNSVSNSSSENLASENTRIRVDQIPFHFLEWVAEYASQDFKNHLYEHVYKEVIESDEISNYFKFFPKIASGWAWYQNKEQTKLEILSSRASGFLMAYTHVRVMTLLFLGQGLGSISWSKYFKEYKNMNVFDYFFSEVMKYDGDFWLDYVDVNYKEYILKGVWCLGLYCSVEDINAINRNVTPINWGSFNLHFLKALVKRDNESILSALPYHVLSEDGFKFFVTQNCIKELKFFIDAHEEIKGKWSNYFTAQNLIPYINPECFQILSQHLEGFFELNSQNQTQGQLEKLNRFFEEAIVSGNIRMTEFFLEKYHARFYVGLERNNINQFCMSQDVIWRRHPKTNGNKIFVLKLMERRKIRGQTNFSPPKVKFNSLEKGSQSLPHPMINFFMICALGEWSRYQWCANGLDNPKLGAIQELIWHVIQNQDRDFGGLVKEWKAMQDPRMQGKTYLDIIRLQGVPFSEVGDIVVDHAILPLVGLFSNSAKEWVANQPKTATEKFIQELLDGARLYAKPRGEVVAQAENEKSFVKKQ